MATLQHLPYLGTAEDDVLFVEWLVDEGAPVKAGVALATVETLKAAFDVEAECDGVLLRCLCQAGQRLPVHAAIAVLGEAGEACDESCVQRMLQAAPTQPTATAAPATPTVRAELFSAPKPEPEPREPPVAPAARRRAAELGIDVATVVGTGPDGLVRVADVECAHEALAAVPADLSADGSSHGRLDAEFTALVRQDQQAFAALRSDFKLQLYRRHGARIEGDCRLGEGTVLMVDRLVLGDGAFFGPGCTIEARQLEAGPLLHFGARCRVRCTRLQFGDNAFFTDDIEIGGGGAMDPEAELVVGSHGFVGEHVHLNPCRRLQLGDEVVVSRNAVIMTHSFGPSALRGHASRFAGVTVGDGAQIGIAATLFPGIDIGAGAVILSGSSVVTSVASGRLFGGVPAVDLKAAAQQLSPRELVERAGALVTEFARQLQLRHLPAVVATRDRCTKISITRDDGEHRLAFMPRATFAASEDAPAGSVAETVWVAVEFGDEAFAVSPSNVTAIGLEPPRCRGPLGPLASAFREFLRKHGVRLHPRTWAYRGGWL